MNGAEPAEREQEYPAARERRRSGPCETRRKEVELAADRGQGDHEPPVP